MSEEEYNGNEVFEQGSSSNQDSSYPENTRNGISEGVDASWSSSEYPVERRYRSLAEDKHGAALPFMTNGYGEATDIISGNRKADWLARNGPSDVATNSLMQRMQHGERRKVLAQAQMVGDIGYHQEARNQRSDVEYQARMEEQDKVRRMSGVSEDRVRPWVEGRLDKLPWESHDRRPVSWKDNTKNFDALLYRRQRLREQQQPNQEDGKNDEIDESRKRARTFEDDVRSKQSEFYRSKDQPYEDLSPTNRRPDLGKSFEGGTNARAQQLQDEYRRLGGYQPLAGLTTSKATTNRMQEPLTREDLDDPSSMTGEFKPIAQRVVEQASSPPASEDSDADNETFAGFDGETASVDTSRNDIEKPERSKSAKSWYLDGFDWEDDFHDHEETLRRKSQDFTKPPEMGEQPDDSSGTDVSNIHDSDAVDNAFASEDGLPAATATPTHSSDGDDRGDGAERECEEADQDVPDEGDQDMADGISPPQGSRFSDDSSDESDGRRPSGSQDNPADNDAYSINPDEILYVAVKFLRDAQLQPSEVGDWIDRLDVVPQLQKFLIADPDAADPNHEGQLSAITPLRLMGLIHYHVILQARNASQSMRKVNEMEETLSDALANEQRLRKQRKVNEEILASQKKHMHAENERQVKTRVDTETKLKTEKTRLELSFAAERKTLQRGTAWLTCLKNIKQRSNDDMLADLEQTKLRNAELESRNFVLDKDVEILQADNHRTCGELEEQKAKLHQVIKELEDKKRELDLTTTQLHTAWSKIPFDDRLGDAWIPEVEGKISAEPKTKVSPEIQAVFDKLREGILEWRMQPMGAS